MKIFTKAPIDNSYSSQMEVLKHNPKGRFCVVGTSPSTQHIEAAGVLRRVYEWIRELCGQENRTNPKLIEMQLISILEKGETANIVNNADLDAIKTVAKAAGIIPEQSGKTSTESTLLKKIQEISGRILQPSNPAPTQSAPVSSPSTPPPVLNPNTSLTTTTTTVASPIISTAPAAAPATSSVQPPKPTFPGVVKRVIKMNQAIELMKAAQKSAQDLRNKTEKSALSTVSLRSLVPVRKGIPNENNTNCFWISTVQALVANPKMKERLKSTDAFKQLIELMDGKSEIKNENMNELSMAAVFINLGLYMPPNENMSAFLQQGDAAEALQAILNNLPDNAANSLLRFPMNTQKEQTSSVLLQDVVKTIDSVPSEQRRALQQNDPLPFLAVQVNRCKQDKAHVEAMVEKNTIASLLAMCWLDNTSPNASEVPTSLSEFKFKYGSVIKNVVSDEMISEIAQSFRDEWAERGNMVVDTTNVILPDNGMIDLSHIYNQPKGKVMYRVVSVVQHIPGEDLSTTSGHYIAHTNELGNCFTYNDEVVAEIPHASFNKNAQQGTIFMLELVNPNWEFTFE